MATAVATLSASELVLGRYRPLQPLGSGGSGSVWLARDETNGLDVALKIVSREGKAGTRAEREAQAAARLRHPKCLRAYAYASDDRNVKPTNVLLADGPDVDVRLLDFGLAQFTEAETLTAAGDVPGTLAYISPERLAGEEASYAADVWAVGVLLWEALVGYHPFWSASPIETAHKIEAGAPPLDSMRPDLPRALLDAIDVSLEVDPQRRPIALELAQRLRDALASKRRAAAARKALPNLHLPTSPRLVAGTSAALFTAATAALVPFYPVGWGWGLASGAAVLERSQCFSQARSPA